MLEALTDPTGQLGRNQDAVPGTAKTICELFGDNPVDGLHFDFTI